jgi:hypothetical protein
MAKWARTGSSAESRNQGFDRADVKESPLEEEKESTGDRYGYIKE